jgi:hypothetical protein
VLRSRSERPSRRCDADKRDEMPSPHESPLYRRKLTIVGSVVQHSNMAGPMSLMGRRRKLAVSISCRLNLMSALARTANIDRRSN